MLFLLAFIEDQLLSAGPQIRVEKRKKGTPIENKLMETCNIQKYSKFIQKTQVLPCPSGKPL